ncbi:pentapeptide repeat-containing protein [Halorubrum ezzemoulense]|uniref:pentapeptide repeat-containing protein n=1 Tax=Halorubrum ezzemoulense TaxID=337243 RepID=UPI00232B7A0B|nr:pentapeptide repeat-containing protein [Halorubrum ezzemoulense]MDB2283050.1 pentapeptide repeat-containing protein [Halorubrum ezzemoulense]
MNAESRCGKLISPSVPDIGDHCCYREEMGDAGRCAWHAESDNKPIGSLSAVIDADEKGFTPICDAYLRDQVEQRRLSIQGLEFIEPDFENVKLFDSIEETIFRQGRIEDIDLFNSDLENIVFDGINIDDSDFNRIDANTVEFVDCDIKNTSFRDTRFNQGKIENVDIFSSDLDDIVFDEFKIDNSSFNGIDAGAVEFVDCDINNTSFTEFSSNNLKVEGSSLSEVEFTEGNLQFQITRTELKDITIHSKCEVANLDNVSLSNCDITNTVLKEGKFSRCKIDNLDLTGTRVGIDFQSCELSHTIFRGANLNSEFNQTDVESAEFSGATVSKLEIFGPCNLSRLKFEGPDTKVDELGIHQVEDIVGLHLRDATLSKLVMDNVSCSALYIEDLEEQIDAPRYEFTESTISGGYFDNFIPASIELSEVQINSVHGDNLSIPENGAEKINDTSFNDCYFSNFTYQPSSLTGLNFNGTTLFHADFNGVSVEDKRALENNTLAYTNLSEADLSLARLTESNLFGSDLTEASLEAADLRGTSFEASTLIGVNFRDARINRRTSFDDQLYLQSMADVQITSTQSFVTYNDRGKKNQDGHVSRYRKLIVNYRRIRDSILNRRKKERSEQSAFLLSCIEIYRELQRLHSENGRPKRARHYRIRSREARRKFALAEGKTVKWVESEFINRVTDYGESWRRLAIVSGAIIFVSGLLYPLFGGIRFSSNTGRGSQLTSEMFPSYLPLDWIPIEFSVEGYPEWVVTLLESMYFSVVTFTTLGYGDVQPVGPAAKFLVGIESLAGVVLMAALVFVLTRKATR